MRCVYELGLALLVGSSHLVSSHLTFEYIQHSALPVIELALLSLQLRCTMGDEGGSAVLPASSAIGRLGAIMGGGDIASRARTMLAAFLRTTATATRLAIAIAIMLLFLPI